MECREWQRPRITSYESVSKGRNAHSFAHYKHEKMQDLANLSTVIWNKFQITCIGNDVIWPSYWEASSTNYHTSRFTTCVPEVLKKFCKQLGKITFQSTPFVGSNNTNADGLMGSTFIHYKYMRLGQHVLHRWLLSCIIEKNTKLWNYWWGRFVDSFIDWGVGPCCPSLSYACVVTFAVHYASNGLCHFGVSSLFLCSVWFIRHVNNTHKHHLNNVRTYLHINKQKSKTLQKLSTIINKFQMACMTMSVHMYMY